MQLTPEIKAQLQEQKKQCTFCKLISGEMEAKKCFEDEKTLAMLDIRPALKGHMVFVLKEHYPIMPYIPPDEFKHYFGLIPQLCQALKEGMAMTGVNVFVANGGIAGQQAPHFLVHFLPRENDDGFFNFYFEENATLPEDKIQMLSHNFPLMMNNHFSRNPAKWHQGNGDTPEFLQEVKNKSKVIYEDEKVMVVVPDQGGVPGHLQIYSKTEKQFIENLSIEDSSHLFFTASFAATAVFEGLGAQGTNLILKSGFSDDNPEGRLCLHVLPRMPEDGLHKITWEAKEPSYNLDNIAERIKDNTWSVKYINEEIKKEPLVVKEVIKEATTVSESNPMLEEIKKAIETFNG